MPTLRPCSKCGEHIVVGDRFCAHCGAEQPVTPSGEGAGAGNTRWDELEKRLQAATEGRYHIRGLIGRGGMAAVYLADWPNMELRIAIKVMDPFLLDQETFVQRFLQEARTIAKLRHRHIIRVYDSGNVDDLFYFCMDYYPGRSMEQVLAAEGPLPIPVVKLWLSQAADALGYAHRQSRPVVHRDVKPSNMLLDKEGDVVLTDFGIAKVRDVNETFQSPSLTLPGSVLGTPNYISPEQAGVVLSPKADPDFQGATGASDQYSLGVVAYEMLCGEPPFSGDLVPLCAAHAEQEPPPILEKRPDCPSELVSVVNRMLHKRPEERWPNMEAICAAMATPPPLAGSPLRARMVDLARGRKAVGSIALTPPSGELFVGQSVKLDGTPLDLGGRPIPDRPLAWTSSDPGIAAVSEDGVVNALKPGPVSITASAEGVSGEISLAVAPMRVDTVVVLPSEISIPEGGEQVLRTLLLSRDGEELADREITWTSNDAEIASVDGEGRVSGHRTGATTVIASSEGRSGRAEVRVVTAPVSSVEVSPPTLDLRAGETAQVTCTPRDAGGNVLEDRSPEWTVDEAGLLEVTEDGRVRALAPGSAVVKAVVEGVAGTAVVTIAPQRVARLKLTPEAGEVVENGTLELTAVPSSDGGEELPDRPILWASDDSKIAQVDGEGRVVGTSPGTARITATCDDVEASARISVAAAPVASLQVFPESLSLSAGETAQLYATPRGPADQSLSGRQVKWSSSVSSVARITEEGRVIGVRPGEVDVVGECGESSASVSVTVIPEEVESVHLQVPEPTLEVGAEVRVGCRVVGASGSELTDRKVTWASSHPDTATVDETGTVRGVTPGQVSVTASCGEREGSLDLTVSSPAVGSVEVQPEEVSILPGETARLQAKVTDVTGQEIPDAPVTWTSSEERIVTVRDDGTAEGRASGKATLAVMSGGVSARVPVEVRPLPAESLEVKPGRIRLKPRKSDEPTVVVRGPGGQVLEGRRVQWASSDPGVAEVDAGGRIRGLRPGTATITARCDEATDSYRLTVDPAGALPAWAPWGMGGAGVVAVLSLVLWLTVGSPDSPGGTPGPAGPDPGGGAGADAGAGGTPASQPGPGGILPGEVDEEGPGEAGATPEEQGGEPAQGVEPPTETEVGQAAAGQESPTGEGQEEERAREPEPPPPEPAITSVSISSPAAEVMEGESLRLRILDQNGNPVDGSFRVSDPSVATVTSGDRLTGRRPGTVTVTATSEGVEGTRTFRVTAAPPAEPEASVLDSLRQTVREARERAGQSDFPTAYELLDRTGARIEDLRSQYPEAPSVGDLYEWFVEEYRATTRDCQLYVEALTGLPGVELPTCKEPPGGGRLP